MRVKKRRKKLRNSLAIALIAAFLVVPVLARSEWVAKDYVTYYGYTDEMFPLVWDIGEGADSYEWRVYSVEKKMYVANGVSGVTEAKIQLPFTGHFIMEVRSKNTFGYSDWAQSIDATKAKVDGEPRAWWVYGHVSPPSGLVIE